MFTFTVPYTDHSGSSSVSEPTSTKTGMCVTTSVYITYIHAM